MNLSRLATLAVFFMMVLSAFVTVPTYNVGADEGGCMDYDDENGNGAYDEGEPCHDDDGDDNPPGEGEGCMDYDDENGNGAYDEGEPCYDDECPFDPDNSDSPCNAQECEDHESDACTDFVLNYCANNNDPGCYALMADFVCYDMEIHEVDFDIRNEEDCYDEDRPDALMWVPNNGGPDDGRDDWDLRNLAVKVEMNSLEEWLVKIEAEYPSDMSDEIRIDVANMCADMLGTSNSEITEDCFIHALEMMGNDDDYGDDHGCPPDLTEDECSAFEDCEDNGMTMSCMRMMYNYCKDNPMCDDEDEECYDDEGNIVECENFIFDMFAFEDGGINATEFITKMDYMFDFDDGDGDTMDDYEHHPYGKYDLYTFTAHYDSEVKIHSDFISTSTESPKFICGDGTTEIPFYDVNEGYPDCDDGADEQWYDSNTPDDMTDDCQMYNNSDCEGDPVNWFDCHDGSKIWIVAVNNDEWNCEDGEDEYQEHDNYWYGHIYLLEGEVSSLGDELSADEIFAIEKYSSGWGDEDKTYVEHDHSIHANLVAGNTYTLVTMGPCHNEHMEDDNFTLVCHNTGHYNHKMVSSNSTMHFEGNLTEDHPMANFDDGDKDDDDSNFVLYNTRTFDVGSDGFSGTITSYGWACYDHDDDGEDDYCHGNGPSLYLYDSFDLTDPKSGLIGSASTDYREDEHDCPGEIEKCHSAWMDIELTPGDYTLVTTFHDRSMFYNFITSDDGNVVTEWDGGLRNAYHDWDSESNESILVVGNERTYMPYPEYREYEPECWDDEGNEIDCDDAFEACALMFSMMENITHYEDGNLTAEEAAENIVDLIYEMVEMGFFDNRGDDGDRNLDDCPFSLDNPDSPCYAEPCDDNHESDDCYNYVEDYCNEYDDYGCGEFVGDDDYNDDPARLDDIVGIQDPDDDDCIMTNFNMIGNVADNEGPLVCSFEFKVTFAGADETKATHKLYIPFAEEESWTLEIVLLEGYEFLECDNCEVHADGIMTGTGPLTVTFGKYEPQADCDYTIGLDSTGMAFDPVKLSIKAGETVCWQWKDAAMEHNVLELEGEYDSTMNLTNINFGFSSGAPSVTVDFRHTFTKDNMTHYYVCEPHAATGMVGQITVGEGSEVDPVQETLDEEGLPSVSFIVGSLVLVGAAGLRRRIH